nr:PilZ domain-containing protein [uncultured Pseudomonas sp.]
MTLDALHLEVPETHGENALPLADLNEQLLQARLLPQEHALQAVLSLLFHLNRSVTTLLERQRALQSFCDEYRHYAAISPGATPSSLFVRLCSELAVGFKRLLLQMFQGRQPSKPHLAWCLYMAQHFLAQTLLRQYQLYQEPAPGLWRDSHLLYWIGERQQCLDEHVAAAFQPLPACTLRGLYQQVLLLALSNPFHLAEGECLQLFGALAQLAELPRLLPWEQDDEIEGPIVDLSEAQPCLDPTQLRDNNPLNLRRFELGALLIALDEPAPLRSPGERQLLERVQQHWQGQKQRRHQRAEQAQACNLIVGLPAVHAQLLEKRPAATPVQMLDSSPGGTRLLCNPNQAQQLSVGQLVLLLTGSATPTLALVRWRHINAEGLHLGLRYLKGLPRPAWLRRAPSAQAHPGILQSTPTPGHGWHHGLWLPNEQFVEGENFWLQLVNSNSQTAMPLPAANLRSAEVSRHAMRLG